jgi:putative ABC transport system permease protein
MVGLPMRYSIRSLLRRRTQNLLTVAGVAVAVFVSVMMLGLSRGLIDSAAGAALPHNVIVLSMGAESMEFSAIEPADFERFRGDGSIAVRDGQPLASPEAFISTFVRVNRQSSSPGDRDIDSDADSDGQRGVVRGIRPAAFDVHGQVRIVEGARPRDGHEVIVGRLAATKMGVPASALAIGRDIDFEGRTWRIVGRFEAPGTPLESEIWAPLDDVLTASRRRDYSAVVLQASSPAAAEDLVFDLTTRTDVRLAAWTEPRFYAATAARLRPIAMVSMAVTALLMLAATMAGTNAMFTAILARTREMAILIVRGYRRAAVLTVFLLESVALCLVGGLVGILPAWLLNDMPMRMPMGAFRFAIDARTVAVGLLLSALIGVIGAAIPMLHVARRPVVEALRAE